MEAKLLRIIIIPSSIAVAVLGGWLVMLDGARILASRG